MMGAPTYAFLEKPADDQTLLVGAKKKDYIELNVKMAILDGDYKKARDFTEGTDRCLRNQELFTIAAIAWLKREAEKIKAIEQFQGIYMTDEDALNIVSRMNPLPKINGLAFMLESFRRKQTQMQSILG